MTRALFVQSLVASKGLPLAIVAASVVLTGVSTGWRPVPMTISMVGLGLVLAWLWIVTGRRVRSIYRPGVRLSLVADASHLVIARDGARALFDSAWTQLRPPHLRGGAVVLRMTTSPASIVLPRELAGPEFIELAAVGATSPLPRTARSEPPAHATSIVVTPQRRRQLSRDYVRFALTRPGLLVWLALLAVCVAMVALSSPQLSDLPVLGFMVAGLIGIPALIVQRARRNLAHIDGQAVAFALTDAGIFTATPLSSGTSEFASLRSVHRVGRAVLLRYRGGLTAVLPAEIVSATDVDTLTAHVRATQ
jgi:hypothetical protein